MVVPYHTFIFFHMKMKVVCAYRFRLPPERLWISVYEDDDEAFEIWHKEVIQDAL